jgi:hypothetical protein
LDKEYPNSFHGQKENNKFIKIKKKQTNQARKEEEKR